jgi:predicted amidohydrolase YtcJ
MQGVHATSDGPWIPKRLGDERARNGAYMWQTLIESGAVVANGTDVPVEDISPIASFYSSVSRRLGDGTVFYEQQRMTREQALHSYTLANAYAAFEEDVKGSITPGKFADVTVLSQDIMSIPEELIPATVVDLTILGGEVVYRRAAQTANR